MMNGLVIQIDAALHGDIKIIVCLFIKINMNFLRFDEAGDL